MKISKLLNKSNLLIIITLLFLISFAVADEQPVDIWKINKEKIQTEIKKESLDEISEIKIENSIYDKQKKKTNTIKLDSELTSKEIKIIGLYDPDEYGLDINMWLNSDGSNLKNLFKNINKFNLSDDAAEILNILLLTNSYYPNQNITKEEFLKFKSDWLIKDSNFEIIEKYLIKNQVINIHPNLTKYLVDDYLSKSDLKKSCEIFSLIKEPIEDQYLSKFNLYCLINYGKNDEAQLILDLKKEMGFKDEYYENKINYLFGYIDETDKKISESTILDFHLAHRTDPDFFFEPSNETPNLIWKYLSTSNLLYNIKDIEITDIDKISTIEKAVHDKNYSEEDLFEFYKRFQFSINQLINIKDSHKSLSEIEGRALVYQRLLLTEDPKLKIELTKILKNLFENSNKSSSE